MNYCINDETLVSFSDGVANVRAELWVDSSEDIPDYDDVPDRVLLPGSVAFVITEGKVYVLGFDNEWVEWAYYHPEDEQE